MSILEKCEQIGKELQNSSAGKDTKNSFSIIKSSLSDHSLFLQIINQNYVTYHFASPDYALFLLNSNRNNETLKQEIESDLKKEDLLKEYAKNSGVLNSFIDELCNSAFGTQVFYEYSNVIGYTPQLIRLSNSLAVECQRTNIIQQFLSTQDRNTLLKLAEEYDKSTQNIVLLPFSKQERKLFNELSSKGFNKYLVQTLQRFVDLKTIMKTVMYESFYSKTLEVDTALVKRIRRITYNNTCLIRISMITLDFQNGWIIKLVNGNSKDYILVNQKTTRFSEGNLYDTITGIVINSLII